MERDEIEMVVSYGKKIIKQTLDNSIFKIPSKSEQKFLRKQGQMKKKRVKAGNSKAMKTERRHGDGCDLRSVDSRGIFLRLLAGED